MMKTIAVPLALLLAVPASALELSLEENRAERGSVGFVDMTRLFAASPDAQRAKENFEELVRQAEEEVNARRATLVRLRQELDGFKAERETIVRSTPTVPSPAPTPKPEPKKPEPKDMKGKAAKAEPAKPGEPAKPAEAPAPRKPLSLPGFDAPGSTGAAVSVTAEPPLAINLPGVTTGQELAPVEPAPAPEPAKPDASAARLIELDGTIAARSSEISNIEAQLEREQSAAERNLLDAESRRTDQVLARLYRAVSEVARRDGVSVVVDKSAILYGHPAVDLTDRVLAHLRGPKQ